MILDSMVEKCNRKKKNVLNPKIFTNHRSCSEVGRRAILFLHLDVQLFSKFYFTDLTQFREIR